MAPSQFCSFCGRYRESPTGPHPDHDSCPYEADHQGKNASNTLLEAIQRTTARDSVALYGWNSSYPSFKTVFKTRSWLATTTTSTEHHEGNEKYETSYFRKIIWVTSNLYDFENYSRIEYDPTSESLITWFTVRGNSEKVATSPFWMYLRMEDPDISYFGASVD